MRWLNYHHLLYFWTVAKEGTVAAAAEKLRLARPTVTAQVRELETAFGKKLFEQRGRRLVLTAFGQKVLTYADDIFALGQELSSMAEGLEVQRRERFVVGIPDVMPKLIAFRLLEPILKLQSSLHLVCKEGRLEDLLADLALHRIDVVISDSAASPSLEIRTYNHKLGECGLSFFGSPELAKKYRRGFPQSLHQAPVILPTEKTAIRRALSLWSHKTGIRPQVSCEFDDSALLKVFGEYGAGLFPAPSAIEREVKRQYNVQLVGRLDDVTEEFYAISLENKLKHPAVLSIYEKARGTLFNN